MQMHHHTLAIAVRRTVTAMTALGLFAASHGTLAQTGGGDTDAVTLDKITVTAQSRAQEVQDVPIALQVIDQRLLNDIAAETLIDLSTYVPGLVIDSSIAIQPSFRLRGVENTDFGIGTDAAVGIFIDGVYSGNGGGGLLPFIDVERIEVLKGPQGTLFGRNTAAGAIAIVTRRPQPHLEGRASVRIGNYGKRYADATFNLPTSAHSALRINALVNRSDGWFRDSATGQDWSHDDNWATRAAWQVRLGDNTTALVSWDHEHLDQNMRAPIGIVNIPPYPQRPKVPVEASDYFDPRSMPLYNDTEGAGDRRTLNAVTLALEHALDVGRLSATTAWRKFDANNISEADATNRADLYLDTHNGDSSESLYQEFKFSGETARLDWVLGASYFHDNARQRTAVNSNTEAIDNIVRNLGIAPTPDGSLFGFTTQLAQLVGIPVSLVGDPIRERFNNSLDNTSYALFGDVIWKLNERLNLTFGLRYTRDEKRFTWLNTSREAPELEAKLDTLEALGFFQALAALGIPITRELLTFDIAFIDPPAMANKNTRVASRNRWSNFSPRVVVDYHFNPDTMAYASLARGYKAGGFNSLQIGPSFENETVWNLEAGIKQSFRRVSWNASVFHYRYDNRQDIRLIDPDPNNPVDIPRFVIDTGDLQATGVDADVRWKVTDAFTIDAAAAWIDSTYKGYVTPEGVSLDGQPTGEPYLNTAIGAAYSVNLGGGELRLSARHAYRGRTRCNAGSDLQANCGISPALNVGEPRKLTNARIGWTSPGGAWEWAAYANNLANHRYVRNLNTYGRGPLGTVGAALTEPRTYGLEVTARF